MKIFVLKCCNKFRNITKNNGLSLVIFLKWSLLGVYHAATSFFIPFGLYNYNSHFQPNGQLSGLSQFSAINFTIVLIVVHLKVLNYTLIQIIIKIIFLTSLLLKHII